MNSEYLLDAVGLLDDDLIREAEQYQHKKPRINYSQWLAWAASFAVVIALGYGVTHFGMGGGGNTAGGNAAGAPSASGGSSFNSEELLTPEGPGLTNEGSGLPDPAEPDTSAPPSDIGESPAVEGDLCAAIMVDGVLYWSTGTPVPGEVDESAVRTVTSYTDTQPVEDGQTNFDRSLTTQYAVTDLGLVVQIDNEWVLFDPVPPWEK